VAGREEWPNFTGFTVHVFDCIVPPDIAVLENLDIFNFQSLARLAFGNNVFPILPFLRSEYKNPSFHLYRPKYQPLRQTRKVF
jgi:hypothetical protein